MAKGADAVFLGTVVKADPPRWNNPDGSGREWTEPQRRAADEVKDLMTLYRTYWVKVERAFKGRGLRAGAEVAVFCYDGVSMEGRVSGPPYAGDRVLVFASARPTGGGSFPDLIAPGVAYHALTSGATSFWKEQGGGFFMYNMEPTRTLTLSEVERLLRAAAGASATTRAVRSGDIDARTISHMDAATSGWDGRKSKR